MLSLRSSITLCKSTLWRRNFLQYQFGIAPSPQSFISSHSTSQTTTALFEQASILQHELTIQIPNSQLFEVSSWTVSKQQLPSHLACHLSKISSRMAQSYQPHKLVAFCPPPLSSQNKEKLNVLCSMCITRLCMHTPLIHWQYPGLCSRLCLWSLWIFSTAIWDTPHTFSRFYRLKMN